MKTRAVKAALGIWIGLVLSVSAVWAGDGEWSFNGPFGGSCNTTIVDPTDSTRIYATCASNIYSSQDGGTSWQLSNQGLLPAIPRASGLAMDPVTPSTLYLGAWPGIYKSVDSGASWSVVFDATAFGFNWATEIAVAPSAPSTVYALLTDTGATTAFYRSVDAGASWQQQAVNLGAFPFVIAVAPDDSTVLYVSSFSSGAFKSTDGGASFSAIGVGVLPGDTQDVVIDPSNSSIVYIGTEDGVFKSTNAGASFSLVGSSEILGTALHFPPDAPETLLAASRASRPGGFSIADSIHQTTNGGDTWEVVPFLHTLARDLAGPMTRLFAASEGLGLYRSLDGGASWSEANTGLGGAAIASLTADPVAKQTVYATGSGGVFKSTDGGESWSRSEDGLEAAIATTDRALRIVVDPQAPETLYTAIDLGIYRSLDGGGSWSRIFDGTQGSFEMLSVNPVNSSDLLAGAFGTVLWRSLDGGASWNPSSTGLPVANSQLQGLWRDPSNPAVLYLQLISGGLYKSVDSGSSWSLLPAAPPGGDALAIDPSDPQVLYLGSVEQPLNWLLKSIDGGDSWTTATSGIVGGVEDLWFSPGDGTTIYARASGIFKSVNGGAFWTRVAPAPVQPNSGGSIFPREALALPNRPETILTATSNEGALVFTEAFFADGFEGGNTAVWSTTVP